SDGDTYQPTTWQIRFSLDAVPPNSTYKFRVALASSANAELSASTTRHGRCLTSPRGSSGATTRSRGTGSMASTGSSAWA
uniref:Uncharacterized protein n=1 Tax=Aegilops tauschii subsp. strangulata TaxID=200361 RepID=A0A453RR46_AEGTS